MALVSYTQPDSGKVQFTMNKNELLSVSKVMADPIFSSESNWFRVSFVFKHTTSNKRFVPSFKSFSGTKSLRIRSGMAVDDQFELKKIIISKSDRTHLVIKTSEIPSVSGYQFSLSSEGQQTGGGSGGSGSQTFATWNPKDGHILNAEGGVEFVGPYQGWVTSSLEMSGDFEFTYELNSAPFEPYSSPYSNVNIGVAPKSWKNSGYAFPKFGVNPQGGGPYGPKKWNLLNGQGGVSWEIAGDRSVGDKITFKRVGNTLQYLINGVLSPVTTDISQFANEPFIPTVGYLTTGEAILKSYKATSSSNSGGGTTADPNAITWYNVDSSKYTAGSNGSLQKLVNGNEVVGVQNSFNGPFEVTYTFNGFLSSGSFLTVCDTQQVASGMGIYVFFNGSNNPIIGSYVGNSNYSFSAVDIAALSSGLNTLTFKSVASGNGLFFKIVLNGVESIGVTGVMSNAGWHTGVRLTSSSDAIVSASKV